MGLFFPGPGTGPEQGIPEGCKVLFHPADKFPVLVVFLFGIFIRGCRETSAGFPFVKMYNSPVFPQNPVRLSGSSKDTFNLHPYKQQQREESWIKSRSARCRI
ncbi:hypothetical protein Mboo_1554 [Methanoregula boonei 6A8]|uniref:Uncharacterized protein n=1 Tax=Methanoregula boonei (strain DSM 21154 / JCM 14090 / 6A8) TaxID=456442 RepID=A7I8L0_METB6|nr:hypothetical protein Mboo_1554 [Methanoregula boonei 6A8]